MPIQPVIGCSLGFSTLKTDVILVASFDVERVSSIGALGYWSYQVPKAELDALAAYIRLEVHRRHFRYILSAY
jgi:hypothetical protein